MARIADDGSAVWKRLSNGSNWVTRALAITADGAVQSGGVGFVSGAPKRYYFWRLRLDNGATIKELIGTAPDAGRDVVAVLPTPSSSVDIVSWRKLKDGVFTQVHGIDSLFSAERRVLSTKKGAYPLTAIRSVDGRLIFAGRTAAKDPDSWLRLADSLGNATRDVTWGGLGHDEVRAVAEQVDGLLVAVGVTTRSGVRVSALRVLDAWGNTSCKEAGVCIGLRYKDCDKGAKCATVRCDKVSGCKHTPTADGVQCTKANGCSLEPVCKSGVCTPGGIGRIFIGRTWSGQSGMMFGLRESRGTVVGQVRKNGKYVAWQFGLDGKIGTPGVGHSACSGLEIAEQIVPTADGGQIVVGRYKNKQAGQCRVDKAGKQQWLTWINGENWCKGCTTHAWDAAETVDHSAYVVGHNDGSKKGWWLLRKNLQGKTMWLRSGLSTTKDVRPRTVVATDVAATVFGGSVRTGNRTWGHAARLTTAGLKTWEITFDKSKGCAAGCEFDDSALGADGGTVLVGSNHRNELVHDAFVVKLDPTGKVKWKWLPSKPDMSRAMAVLLGPSSAVTIAGDIKVNGQWRPQVRIVAGGQLVKAQIAARVGAIKRGSGLRLSDGGAAFGGSFHVDPPTTPRPGVMRLGVWADTDCKSAGACFGKKLKDCDDGNPCTIDSCTHGKGCTNTAIEGMWCSGGTCKGGTCTK